MYVFRDYKESDFNEVMKLWEDTGMGSPQRGDNNEIIVRTIKSGGKFIIMENKDTGEIIGTSWLTTDQRRIYLHHFGIKPQYQGQGLSHALAEESIKFARTKNMQIKLEVHKTNTKAIKLYEKHGFKYLGDYLVYIIRKF
ncbi:MAG: hypothetical protein Kow0068_04370 [Marinilabiliales bacterium]